VLVEGRKLLREALSLLLEQHADIKVIGEAEDSTAAAKVVHALSPDVVVLTITSPAFPTRPVPEILHDLLSSRSNKPRVIVHAMSPTPAFVREVLRAGAAGCLSKDCASDDVADVLDIRRHRLVLPESMARYGYSPATRVFEAAGAAACVITDDFVGIETFFEPEKEILSVKSGDDVARTLDSLTTERAKQIGQAAYRRVLSEHTYDHRAQLFEEVLDCRRSTGHHPLQTGQRLVAPATK
jgi:hypothetical protein